MEPLVSVIIPVYNVLPYLREALESVINQTYRNLEIIIVDDGSTDGSGEMCDEYNSDPHIQVIHQSNRGLSGARNAGLDLIRGEYVTFLDSDDAFHNNAIEKHLQTITDHNADIAVCGYNIFETESSLKTAKLRECVYLGKERNLTPPETIDALLDGPFAVMIWHQIFKSHIWDNLRFPEGHVYEDLYVTPSVLKKCSCIAVSPLTLVDYRIRKDSISRTVTPEYMQDQLTAYKVFLNYAESVCPAAEKIKLMRGNVLRMIIMRWAELRKTHDVEMLTTEIKLFANQEIHFKDLKSQVSCMLFQYCPQFLSPARTVYRGFKRMFKRTFGRKS